MTRALLYVCVRPQRDAADGEYESFRLAMGLERSQLARHDLVEAPLPSGVFENYSGFIVGGSPFNVADPESSKPAAQLQVEAGLEEIAAEAAAQRTSAMFTCFGIGIVARMLGTAVSRAYPEDTGPTTVTLTADGGADQLTGVMSPTFTAFTAHKEGAAELPEGTIQLATNDDCPVQAFRLGDRLYATQFHPEPTPHAFTERMTIYRDGGYFDSRDYDAVAARVLAASVTEPPRLLRAFALMCAKNDR
ncbi:glutamine amidotransferase-related protein [Microbacterium halimionae]|uniref:glutamine amidotransferase-related protein n=1 Tax=Microbacterium halimionae TaxID=1526413 RepID=UPI00142463F7|nr:GMP synthase [Microbacterium halimionae]NII94746.1 GMP synthase (glutamine-hydrolysing) [Microbacterium halimionae]